LAALLEFPPDLVDAADLSNTDKKLINPDDVPPPESFSLLPRSKEKFDPQPLP
jgi:hypothetical protein